MASADIDRLGLPDVSSLTPGAVSLLALAGGAYGDASRERVRDILDGTIFRRLFDLATRLPELCKQALLGSDTALRAVIGPHDEPETLFDFFVALHDTLWRQIAAKAKRYPEGPDRLTGFDHAAFLANFQSFLYLLGAEDGVGPRYEVAVSLVAELDPRTIQHHFTVNYLGNLMQDYFETAVIRRSSPGLPADTEARLREEDGVRAAEIVFAEVQKKEGPLDWPTYQAAAKRFLTAVALLEREQHAAREG
jgi:hypothetical protein